MPETPDLEVIVEFIADRAVGAKIQSAAIIKPSVLRSLCGDLASDILGRALKHIERRGKFMLLRLSDDRVLAVNPMLTGALQYCPRGERVFKRTCVRLSLSNGQELRYLDDRQMGSVYYVSEDRLNQVPRLMEQGPDVLSDISFEDFQRSLRPFHGEIKGILTRGRVIAGIGNAYSDEILFAAGIYPFRKRKALSDGELRRVYESSRGVVQEAIPILRERMGENIHIKVRDFLKVHNKVGTPCPRCGKAISQVTANRRITSYCRRCQPGMLISN